jgi:guanylate kinase
LTRSTFLIVLSAPSGTGKTTLCREVAAAVEQLQYSVSATTRPARPGERDGRDYRFLEAATFKRMIDERRFIEWAIVYDHYYGTLREPVERWLEEGNDVILDLDVQGARAIRAAYPAAVLIYVFPPSLASLRERLSSRGTDDSSEIERRIAVARREMEEAHFYGYFVVNKTLSRTVEQVRSIVVAERVRSDRVSLLGWEEEARRHASDERPIGGAGDAERVGAPPEEV